MDINCTDTCEYQMEGKCGLSETPDVFTSGVYEYAETESDCPYYVRKSNGLTMHKNI